MTFSNVVFETFDYVKFGEFMNISVMVSAQDEVCSV